MSLRSRVRTIRAIPGLGRDLAVLSALILLGTAVGGYILSQQRFELPWASRYTFTAEFAETPAISPGNGQEVRIAGVPVGEIVAAEVTEAGTSLLIMELEREHAPVYTNATLELTPKSPLNDLYVRLDPGGPPARPVEPDEPIPVEQTVRPVQVDEVLDNLDERTRLALQMLLAESGIALADASDTLPRGLAAAPPVLERLRPVVERLESRREKIRLLVTALADISKAVGENDRRLARLIDSARVTLDAVAANDDELTAALRELPGFVSELDDGADAIDDLSQALDPALRDLSDASDELPGALKELRGFLDRLDATVAVGRPVVAEARPLAADLRRLGRHARPALADLAAVSPRVDPITAMLADALPDVQRLVYWTTSADQFEDANGPILRGLVTFGPQTVSLPQELEDAQP